MNGRQLAYVFVIVIIAFAVLNLITRVLFPGGTTTEPTEESPTSEETSEPSTNTPTPPAEPFEEEQPPTGTPTPPVDLPEDPPPTGTPTPPAEPFEEEQPPTDTSTPPVNLPEDPPPTGTPIPPTEPFEEEQPSTNIPPTQDKMDILTLGTPWPAIEIDPEETQAQDRSEIDHANTFRVIRWRPWQEPSDVPDDWFYVINFLPANDRNMVYQRFRLSEQDWSLVEEGENTGWIVHNFDIATLEESTNSCFPYWDVTIGIETSKVNCPEDRRSPDGICRLTDFPSIQQYLGTSHPGVSCGPGGGGGGSREGSSNRLGRVE